MKNSPDCAHQRSLNSEAITWLAALLLPCRMPPAERLARARELPQGSTRMRNIDTPKRNAQQ